MKKTIPTLTFRDSNLSQFHRVVVKAYKEAQAKGMIPKKDIPKYDKLMTVGYSVRNPRTGRLIFPWGLVRRRAARLYRCETGVRVKAWDIDWEAIYQWVLDNIVPILKILLMLLPFLI